MRGFIIFVSVLLLSCVTTKVERKEVLSQSYSNKEPGKCYYALKNNEEKEWGYMGAMIIEIQEPTYIKRMKKIDVSEIIKNNSSSNTISIQVRKAHVVYQFANSELDQLNYKREYDYAYCMVERPSFYKGYFKDSLSTNEIEIEIVEISNPAKITYLEVNGRPEVLLENQIYLPPGRWSKERELVYGTNCPMDIYLKVKMALNERGFNLEETNKVDAEMLEALHLFQKRNNLEIGKLNSETLRKLGL